MDIRKSILKHINSNIMRKFIKDNHLSFEEGRRNSTVTVLVGYSQHLGISKDKLKEELAEEISSDSFIGDEIDKLYRYCEDKNYKAFWRTEEAKKQYKF